MAEAEPDIMSIQTRYDKVAIGLHWLTALAILSLFAMGWTMTSLRPGSTLQFSLYQWHKSVGITVLALTGIRVAWRLAHPAPALPNTMPEWEKILAKMGHLGLYALMIAMPAIGWGIVSTSAFNIPTMLYGFIPLPHLGFLVELADKAALNKTLQHAHETGGVIMIVLLIGHVGAALRHHFLLRDGVLARMLPFALVVLVLGSSAARASEWSVDLGKSQLGFVGNQSGSQFDGRFSRWTAKIDFDPAKPNEGHAVISIDMGSAVTGNTQKDLSLPQAEWFDTQHFPQATFEAKGFQPKGGDHFEAKGHLTIRGHDKEVVLPFTLDIAGDTAHAKGRLSLVRTDYGVGQGAWSTAQYVGLDVAVTVDLVAAVKK